MIIVEHHDAINRVNFYVGRKIFKRKLKKEKKRKVNIFKDFEDEFRLMNVKQ